jgi:hypothetical protein
VPGSCVLRSFNYDHDGPVRRPWKALCGSAVGRPAARRFQSRQAHSLNLIANAPATLTCLSSRLHTPIDARGNVATGFQLLSVCLQGQSAESRQGLGSSSIVQISFKSNSLCRRHVVAHTLGYDHPCAGTVFYRTA